MRSPSDLLPRLAPLALAALAGCGNYSNEDIRFVEALPRREELQVAVPSAVAPAARFAASGPLAAFGACNTLMGTADTWLTAERTGNDFNRGIDWLLGLVDVVRRVSPTHREADLRRWGPFDDRNHPGNEIQIVFTRTWPALTAPDPRYAYSFEARPKGAGAPFTPVLFGTFVGPSASRGRGQLELQFDAIWSLGMQDADTPHGAMDVRYDRTGAAPPSYAGPPPARTSHLRMLPAIQSQGFGLVEFDYAFAGWPDGSGRFDYAFLGAAGHLLTVSAGFDATGAGRDLVQFFTQPTDPAPAGTFEQCWGPDACLTWVSDPSNLTCPTGPLRLTCSGGDVGTCVAVPGPVPGLPPVP